MSVRSPGFDAEQAITPELPPDTGYTDLTDTNANSWVSSTHTPMGFVEFVLIIASVMALNPLALDLMLPALPSVGTSFSIHDGNRLQEVLSIYLTGFGIGQFFLGPLSDRFGRRPVLLWGMTFYCAAGLLVLSAPSFETMLLARLLQGASTAATRVIAISIVRDCYSGRRMASVMSSVMMIFILVPIVAPSIGQLLLFVTDWRGIFAALLLYGAVAFLWSALRMPETLPLTERRSLAMPELLKAFRHVLGNRQTLGYALAAGVVQGSLFAFVFSSQQIFVDIFQLGYFFPVAFAVGAVGICLAAFLNSRLVGRMGMRVLSHGALMIFAAAAGIMLLAASMGSLPLPLFLTLATLMMFAFGLTFSNFTALAMEPQGHLAGTASSIYGTITTLVGIMIGSVIGQQFNGTLLPISIGFFICSLATIAIVAVAERGRLFKPHHRPI